MIILAGFFQNRLRGHLATLSWLTVIPTFLKGTVMHCGIYTLVQKSPAFPLWGSWLIHPDIDQYVLEPNWRYGNSNDSRTPNHQGTFGATPYRLGEKLSLGGCADIDAPGRHSGPASRDRLLEMCQAFIDDPRFSVYISKSARGFHVLWDWTEPVAAESRPSHSQLSKSFLNQALPGLGIEQDEICSSGKILFFWTTKPTPANAFKILSTATELVEAPAQPRRPQRNKINPESFDDLLLSSMDDPSLALCAVRPRLLTERCIKFLELCNAQERFNANDEIYFTSHWNLVARACEVFEIPFESPIQGKRLDQHNMVLNPAPYGFDCCDFSRPIFNQNIFIG